MGNMQFKLIDMGVIKGFIETGRIIHDDKIDFAGTFVNMTDEADNLKMSEYRIFNSPATSGGINATGWNDAEKFRCDSRYLTTFYIHGDSWGYGVGQWRLGTTLGGTQKGSGNWSMGAEGDNVWRSFSLNVAITPNVWYYCTINQGSGEWVWDRRPDIGPDCVRVKDGSEDSGYEWGFQLYGIYISGSYESQVLDGGVGVTWGQFLWTEVLSDATLIMKCKTSPDGINWDEEWQILSNEDWIIGQNRFFKYRAELSNATITTLVDDINITYML